MSDTIKISEIFGPTIQGEGALIGQPTVFVRTGGCDYRCTWCDTLYAVESRYRHDWFDMTTDEVWTKVQALSGHKPVMVTLSGGNPAIQPLGDLIRLGHAEGYRFNLETQGSIAADWFTDLDVLTFSPKPPSSDMDTDWAALDHCIQLAANGPEIIFKIVVFDDADYAYAQDVATRYPDFPLYLQVGNHEPDGEPEMRALNERLRWLADKVTADCWFDAKVLPQLHVMMWGNERGM